ncbi:hypothetical protein M0R45_025891 [Rubus argutus]|uniref:Uncharacterized protein n=1 Tax=Rubus argutus TaxID=59490 RepID=A0AAW1WVW5_RUBAR
MEVAEESGAWAGFVQGEARVAAAVKEVRPGCDWHKWSCLGAVIVNGDWSTGTPPRAVGVRGQSTGSW